MKWATRLRERLHRISDTFSLATRSIRGNRFFHASEFGLISTQETDSTHEFRSDPFLTVEVYMCKRGSQLTPTGNRTRHYLLSWRMRHSPTALELRGRELRGRELRALVVCSAG